MLNRRYLRIKVMQSLYGLEIAKSANYQIAKDLIHKAFVPDWDEKPDADLEELEKKRQMTYQVFEENFKDPQKISELRLDNTVRKVAINAINYYHNQLTRDINFFSKNLLSQADMIYDSYILTLALIPELAGLAAHEKEKKKSNLLQSYEFGGDFKLKHNAISNALKANKLFEGELLNRNLNWHEQKEMMHEVYRNVLKKDDTYQEYNDKEPELLNFEEEREIIRYILKSLLFKRKNINNFIVNEIVLDRQSFPEPSETEVIKTLLIQIKETLPVALAVFAKEIEIEPEKEQTYQLVQQITEKIQKEAWEISTMIENSQPKSDDSELKESQKIVRKLSKEKLINQQIIHFTIQEIVIVLNDLLKSYDLNQVDFQKRNLMAFNESIVAFFEGIGGTLGEEDKIVLEAQSEKITSVVDSFFEEMDLTWTEDHTVVVSMVQKTIKSIERGGETDFELVSLSKNWEEDKFFYEDLFRKSVEEDKKYEDIIRNKSKNWNLERLALLDKVIIKMAICEMIHFYSIPVKVSINEYIELSKMYSTPKSKQFINGLLDAISQELIKKKIIKKSGRGLMDNK